MSRFRGVIILAPVGIILALIAGMIAVKELRNPPLEKLHFALTSLDAARRINAPDLAGAQFQLAEKNLTAGQKCLNDIQRSWWPFGSYRCADSLLSESIRLSTLAGQNAEKKQISRNGEIRHHIGSLKDSLAMWQDVLSKSLPRIEDELLMRPAISNLQLAESMLQRNQHQAAEQYADSVRALFAELADSRQRHSEARQTWLQKSRDWTTKTVGQSHQTGKPAVIVDKSRHFLFILSSGKVVDSMKCDLGYNSGYQKRMAGDGATPEGMYAITHINNQSRYYRAMMLNYPNANDRERFKRNRSSGQIPASSTIGGLIEIHGHGGTGKDWTDGCVAVSDRDMDQLVRRIPAGTPVTIVGSWEAR